MANVYRPAIIKKCMQCKKEFKAEINRIENGRGKFCSKNCFNLYQHITKSIKINCAKCSKEFYAEPNRIKRGRRFCSQSCAKKGRIITKEWREKISKTLIKKGLVPWMKGKHHSMESLKKMSIANLGREKPRTAEHQGKLAKPCPKCGIFMRKIGNHICMSFRETGLKGLLKQMTMKEPTSIEKKVYEELKTRGILFEKQKLINGRFLVDAYIPSLNLVIEADGDYWHSLDRVKKRDKTKNAYLTKCGYNMLRLSESEINNGEYIKKLDEGLVN